MNSRHRSSRISSILFLAGIELLATYSTAESASPVPYKIVNSVQWMGTGRIDYVYADSDGRRLYVPRGGEVLAFDLDTLKQVGTHAIEGGHAQFPDRT
ncbi:hypothetical protein CfE428DRAFT_6057 [Chthoniobacter flavus Ellin428]|uniref:Uncharacterized protein n=1 Tax=Chthoniobacter flavus Ellin428 TaxID=497964 RepID=B4DAW6_9BACT|nr:hypothetical protein [Chthoniobacter flavus]EDY16438.1 hypothetical protein CfE428DRAFT_6057 [Chthoniobacter flavus Ellin428]TCO84549.1 hypothetical protein EV701_13514 [Chthoniobacter flavus]